MNKEKLKRIAHEAFCCRIEKCKQQIRCIECESTSQDIKYMIDFWQNEIKEAHEAYYKIKELIKYHMRED